MITLFNKPAKRRRALIVAEIALLVVGFVSLGWAGYMTVQRLVSNSWQNYRFEQALQGHPTTLKGYLEYLFEADSRHAEDEQPGIEREGPPPIRARKLAPDELIGRIDIPRVKVSVVVKEGVGAQTLSQAAGHVPYTALPGEKGNVGVAAHRDTFFRGLRDVRAGDQIRLQTLNGIFTYEVRTLKVVWPKDVEVLDPTPDRRLTLVTCYPFNYIGSAPKRFIVQAKQISFEQQSAKTDALPTIYGRRPKSGT